jgi:hypothetical protein
MINKKTILILISALIFSYCNKSPTDSSPPGLVTGMAAVNGTSLYYEIQGKGHPLVLIEGGQLDLRMWDDQFSELSKNYQVIRYDLRGFGRSGESGASYQAHEDLRALLDTLAIERIRPTNYTVRRDFRSISVDPGFEEGARPICWLGNQE